SIDALLVINFLNSKLPTPTSTAGGYLDSNGDTHISSIDALLVISRLNAHLPALPVSLGLVKDAGDSSSDHITNDPHVSGAVTLDTVVPSFTPPQILAADDTGLKNNDNITQVTRPHITLTAQAGEHLRVLLDGTPLFDGASPGAFQQQTSALADGTHTLFAGVS